jgi:hypothetical protein
LPDGRIATIGPQFGAQYVVLSADHGATWNAVTIAIPFGNPVGVTYSSQQKAFYVWQFTCDPDAGLGVVLVPSDAIVRFDFDYQKN